MRFWREPRLIPVVLIAAGCLFALKATGLWFEGGYTTLGQRLNRGESVTVTTVPASPSTQLRSPAAPLDAAAGRAPGTRSWAQEMFNYPEVTGSVARRNAAAPPDTVIVTGAVGAKDPPKDAAKDGGKDAGKNGVKDGGKDAAKDGKDNKPAAKPFSPTDKANDKPGDMAARPDPRSTSQSERAILERLLERRQELDARHRELELRENLLKAAEKNLEDKVAAQRAKELGPEGRVQNEAEAARFKSLVTMYETMKPKEAAKIFDRLDIRVLSEVAGKINPRRMAEILAQMSPEAAERFTLEFAVREADKVQKPGELPKIEGRPTN